jgi:isopentenyl diphosphate isomerase/L-lactate dehydrogenase-like FMN-dependent dehydrogenase
VLDGLTAELAATMDLLGAPTVADLTPDLVARSVAG